MTMSETAVDTSELPAGTYGTQRELVRLGNDAVERTFAELCSLGLERHALELDMYGYTLLEPEVVQSKSLCDDLAARIMSIAEERDGRSRTTLEQGGFAEVYDFFFSDGVFEEALMNPVVLALVTYLLGEHCVLSTSAAFISGPRPAGPGGGWHADANTPAPLPPWPISANVQWTLTDAGRDSGGFGFVRGSHRLCRHPVIGEQVVGVPANPSKGSVLVWPSNTWHGSVPGGATSALDVSMLLSFHRPVFGGTGHFENVTVEQLQRNPARFATLMGDFLDERPGPEGPDRQKYYNANARRQLLY